uniref:Subunit VI of cytochrome b6/f complex n=1 Tax=Neodangemannia microcystis TaxID=173495 RepID=A0A1W6EH66_9CHLO|nr:subunit VI of cytochrome b6/f complex [Neodangemannia microcystis]ARK14748.1 subunit VI of cytochrome b6/f complex [Neodangemannia microcystis]
MLTIALFLGLLTSTLIGSLIIYLGLVKIELI